MKLSVRKLEPEGAVVRLSLTVLMLMQGLLPGTLCAEALAKRYPVTTEMVVTAMQYRQLPTAGVEVKLAAPITAAADNPMLEIETVTQLGPHSAQLKVGCRTRSQCLPFYVAATWPEAVPNSTPSSPVHEVEPSHVLQVPAETPSAPTVKPGAHATLLIEEGKVHIRLQVVCLQGGSAGDKVRVSSTDHKVAYKAEVVGPDLLKGSF